MGRLLVFVSLPNVVIGRERTSGATPPPHFTYNHPRGLHESISRAVLLRARILFSGQKNGTESFNLDSPPSCSHELGLVHRHGEPLSFCGRGASQQGHVPHNRSKQHTVSTSGSGTNLRVVRIDCWPVKTQLPLSSVEKHGCGCLCALHRHLLHDPRGAHDSERFFAPGPHRCCSGVDASDGHAGRVRLGFFANNIQCPRSALGRVPEDVEGIENLTETRNVG